jgi:flagellar protein FliO/FliZ
MRYLLFSLLFFCSGQLARAGEGAAAPAAPSAPAAPLPAVVGAGDLLQVAFSLLLVVALIVLTAWFIRRFSGATLSRNGALRLLAGISVGQRERIVLVQAGEVQLLLGVAPGEVRTLHVFDKPVLLDTAGGKGAERFAERLMSAMNTRKGEQL